MACTTLANRNEPCKEFSGGIKGIWIIPFNNNTNVITKAAEIITLMTTAGDLITPISANFFELKGLSTMNIATITSPSGNTSYTTTLTLSLKPAASPTDATGEADNILFDVLVKGRWHILVWDRNNQIRLIGEELGVDASGGDDVFGTEVEDARLNTLTFESKERFRPALVTGDSASDINGTVITLLP